MVEKKSTGKAKSKRTAAKPPEKKSLTRARKPKPTSEVQQTVEQVKPWEINWDVVGFSSAAVTLAGAALLFMLGWAYEVNWYGYFGVSMSQVSSLPQNVIIQSIPSLVTFFSAIVLIILILVAAESLVRFVILVSSAYRDKSENAGKPTSIKFLDLFHTGTRNQTLLIVLAAVELLLLIIIWGNWDNARKTYGEFNRIYEIFYLEFFASTVRYGLLGAFIPIALIGVCLFIVVKIYKLKLSHQMNFRGLPSNIVLFILIFTIIFTLISTSAVYAVNDAAHGFRGSGGWSIQPLYLVSSEKFYFPNSIKQTCDDSICASGLFGLIGENDNNYILIKWKEDDHLFFSYHPGIFVIPKSENTYLISFTIPEDATSIPQVSPISSEATTRIPISTPTMKSTLRATITPTSTPAPIQP